MLEEEHSFGFDVCQESGKMEVFAYHHLVKVEFFPKSEPKEADKVVVTLWAHRGEIVGYGLKPLVQAMARGRGFSIEVMPEKLAIFARKRCTCMPRISWSTKKAERRSRKRVRRPHLCCAGPIAWPADERVAVSGVPPGSAFRPLTTAAALSSAPARLVCVLASANNFSTASAPRAS